MKTYKNLLKPMLTPESVAFAMLQASKHKLRRNFVLKSVYNFDRIYWPIVQTALNPNYYPENSNTHTIIDGTKGKKRVIVKPSFFPDQIIHHILIEPFKEIVLNGLYEHVYGSLPPKKKISSFTKQTYYQTYGVHTAAKYLRKWVQVNKKIYVAELDIHKAYDSVDLDILLDKLSKVIKDKEWLDLMRRIIKGRWNKSKGLALGHYTSPWLFHFYLKDFDHFVASMPGLKYLRYADNLFLVSTNKRVLRYAILGIGRYLYDNLKLLVNNSSQLYRFEYEDRYGNIRGRAINALGFVIHRNRVTIRKSILKGIRRKALRIHKKDDKCTWYDAASMLSHLSWFRGTDSYEYYLNYIKPNIDVQMLKSKISIFSKMINKFYKKIWRFLYDRLGNSLWLTRNEAG